MYDRSILSTIEYHHAMLADDVRMQSYLQAILKAVEPGDIVLDIGSGTGILAYFACMAGARHVYAVEQDPLIGLAEAISHQNGFQDRITFINDWSDHVELPQPVDVLVTETIGNMGFEEGVLGWIIDARDRLLAENGRIVPRSVELVMVPTEDPGGLAFLHDWQEESYTLDLSPVGGIVANNLIWHSLSPKSFLSAPAVVAQAELVAVESSEISGEAQFVASRDGEVHGLGCWFRSTLVSGITISNGPPFNTPSWTQILLPMERPLPVSAGDCLHVQVQASANGAHWHWQVGREREEMEIISQSTLAGRLRVQSDQSDSEQKPLRSVEGEVDFFILQMMDGSTTVKEIARHAAAKFPLQFGGFDEAFDHVHHVSEFYGRRTNKQLPTTARRDNGYPSKLEPAELM